jgi:hypothetical protein
MAEREQAIQATNGGAILAPPPLPKTWAGPALMPSSKTLIVWRLALTEPSRRPLGRPGYQPATLMKIFIYGHLNRVPSRSRCSARQERAYGAFLAVIAAPTCR